MAILSKGRYAFLLPLVVGCIHPQQVSRSSKATEAEIVVASRAPLGGMQARHTIVRGAIVEELEALFPAMGKAGARPAPWAANVEIHFHYPDGSRRLVMVNGRHGLWSEGNGDWGFDRDRFQTILSRIFPEG